MQTTSSTIRAHTSALLAFTQLQELGLRINMEGQAATTEGCLDPLTALTCLTSLKIRTFRVCPSPISVCT